MTLDPSVLDRYPAHVIETRRNPGSRVVRLVVDIDDPDLTLVTGVRRQLAADHAAVIAGGNPVNVIDRGPLRFDVRVWLPPENVPEPLPGM